MPGRQALLAAVLAMSALAGCGADEAPLTETERTLRAAQELTVETGKLGREIARDADELAAARSDERREEIEERLEEQGDRADELAGRAREELPESLPVQDELERAGERLAAAAQELLSFADSGDDDQLSTARTAISEARQLQASAANQLADHPPPELRKLIEQLRDRPPPPPSF